MGGSSHSSWQVNMPGVLWTHAHEGSSLQDGQEQLLVLLSGVAYGKSKPLAWTGPRELGPLHIVSQHLTVIHEHIILGSAGFWSMLSANDAVLLSHFMTKV